MGWSRKLHHCSSLFPNTAFRAFASTCLIYRKRYYLARVLETVGIASYKEKNIINGCLMIWSWICSLCAAFLTAHLRRRTQFLISTSGMLAIFASQTLCAGLFNDHGNVSAGYAVIAMLFLFYTFCNLGFNALLYTYPVPSVERVLLSSCSSARLPTTLTPLSILLGYRQLVGSFIWSTLYG